MRTSAAAASCRRRLHRCRVGGHGDHGAFQGWRPLPECSLAGPRPRLASRGHGRRRGMTGGGGLVWSAEEKKIAPLFLFLFFLRFLTRLTCGPPVQVNKRLFFATSALIRQFPVNSRSIPNQCTLRTVDKNVVVLCDSNVKSWFFRILPIMLWFYTNYSGKNVKIGENKVRTGSPGHPVAEERRNGPAAILLQTCMDVSNFY
jgi:hypothetical protein